MEWETEQLKKVMFIGERLIWGTNIKTITPKEERMNLGWRKRNIYFTDQRILWDVTSHIPDEIPYSAVSKVGKGAPGSGGFAGAWATAGGGGVIDVMSTYATLSLQFQDGAALKYANWLLNTAMSGADLKPAEGTPNVSGEKDPNAAPPAPKESKGGCFIATAAYGSPLAEDVTILRAYRDEVLRGSNLGRRCISAYYYLSPPFARIIEKQDILRFLVRHLLAPAVIAARKSLSKQ